MTQSNKSNHVAIKIKFSSIILATYVFSLASIQVLFFLMQNGQALNVEQSLQSLLRNEINLKEPYRLAQGITDLENIGLFRCSVLKNLSQNQIYQNLSFKWKSSECVSDFFNLNGLTVESKITSINGSIWQVNFISNNSESFYLALWITRCVLLIVVLSLAFAAQQILKNIEIKNQHLREINQLSIQVAHDIRSPLSALNIAMREIDTVDSRQILIFATDRINQIANKLLERGRAPSDNFESLSANLYLTELVRVLEQIVNEKKVLALGKKISFSFINESGSQKKLIHANLEEFKCIFSNLLCNSMESIEGNGTISIKLTAPRNEIEIAINDSGIGISKANLSKIGNEKFTTKKNGNGIGVYSAMEKLKSWTASMEVQSILGHGTEVKIKFPIQVPGASVILIDNDPLTCKVWEKSAKKRKITLVSFANPQDFNLAASVFDRSLPIYIDMDLGIVKNGIQISKDISELGFHNLFIATAYPLSHFGHDWKSKYPWLKSIIGKEPPWLS